MPTEKTVNYTDEMVADMTRIYQAAGSELGADGDAKRQAAMLEIQKLTGKSLPSIRSKLGNLGIYVPKDKPAGKKSERVTKAALVAKVQDAEPDRPSGFFDSLEGATKNVIQYVIDLQAENASLRDTYEPADETDSE